MVWVRANRARLVAACLILCRAWIAAGRPRGARTIGSYESWAQTIGGVLAVLLFTSLSGSFKSLMIGQFTYSIMGHLEIHAKGYVASIDPKTMEHVETALKSENNVVAYRPNHTLEQLAAMQ